MFYRIENIPDEQTMQAVVANLLPLVPFARRDKALRYKHLHGQYTCLRTWQLLHSLLIEHAWLPADFPLADLTYTEDAHGKPWLSIAPSHGKLSEGSSHDKPSVGSSPLYFSLSHTKTALAVAIARFPIGIDIETIISDRRLDQTFLDHTMSLAEQTAIRAAADPCLAFTELWTRKEALFKALGTGIEMASLPSLLADPGSCTFLSAHADTYAYSIASLQASL